MCGRIYLCAGPHVAREPQVWHTCFKSKFKKKPKHTIDHISDEIYHKIKLPNPLDARINVIFFFCCWLFLTIPPNQPLNVTVGMLNGGVGWTRDCLIFASNLGDRKKREKKGKEWICSDSIAILLNAASVGGDAPAARIHGWWMAPPASSHHFSKWNKEINLRRKKKKKVLTVTVHFLYKTAWGDFKERGCTCSLS